MPSHGASAWGHRFTATVENEAHPTAGRFRIGASELDSLVVSPESWDEAAQPSTVQSAMTARTTSPLRKAEAKSAIVNRPSLPTEGAVRKRVVLSSVSSDSHTWNLVFMQLLLENMGHQVTNLGACTPDEEIIEACKRHAPDLLVISTVNGHGNIDGERLISSLRQDPQLSGLLAVIGGQLGTRGLDDQASLTAQLLFAGFSAVFNASTLSAFQDFVKRVSTQEPIPCLPEVVP